MKNVLVIYNPVAGHHSPVNLPKIIHAECNKAGVTVMWFDTLPQEKQPLEQFLTFSFDLIMVVGGDGTVNEVAKFILHNKLKTPLAIVANGSGNILAQSLKIPIFPSSRAVTFALKNKPRKIDVMQINEKFYGLIAAGQGYDVIFVHGATRELKRWFGIGAYLVSFFKTFFAYRRHTFTVEVDGKIHIVKAKVVAVFNVLSLFGVHFHKAVKVDDGILNVVVINPRSLWDLVRILFKTLFSHAGPDDKRLRFFEGKEIRITEADGQRIQVDGEIMHEKSLHVTVLPNALTVIY